MYLFSFANPEHLGLARGTDTFRGWLTVLHSDDLGTLHLFLGFAFDTIRFH